MPHTAPPHQHHDPAHRRVPVAPAFALALALGTGLATAVAVATVAALSPRLPTGAVS